MLPAKAERPIFWIVAGPNGSGKSSLYQNAIIEAFNRTVWIINPDLLSARIRKVERKSPKAANLAAVQRIESWLQVSITAHQTIGVETVLSTAKYRRLVKLAKRLQFEFCLIYVLLDSPERNIERVRIRVAKGGHNVPKAKIAERYVRSLAQLPWFLRQADRAYIFDNSCCWTRTLFRRSRWLPARRTGPTSAFRPTARYSEAFGHTPKEPKRTALWKSAA
jgi:predicted ABC-type ATPase